MWVDFYFFISIQVILEGDSRDIVGEFKHVNRVMIMMGEQRGIFCFQSLARHALLLASKLFG